jgi:hypothetical protein
LKQITAIWFMVALIGQTFHKPFVLLDYHLNIEAYAKKCVNKAKPKLRCQGRCQAMKKMQEEEKKQPSNRTVDVLQDAPFVHPCSAELPNPPIATAGTPCTARQIGIPVHRSYACFHPPKTC